MWLPGIRRFAAARHWQLIPLIKDGCVPSTMSSGDCASWYAWAEDQLTRLRPDAVIVSQYWSSWGDPGVRAVVGEARAIAARAPRVLLVEDAPTRPEAPVDCLLAGGATLGSCAFHLDAQQVATYGAAREGARAAGAAYVPTLHWLCSRGRCPAVVGNVVTYRDRHHVSATYARLLARPLANELRHLLP
jgi:hypothetical protein